MKEDKLIKKIESTIISTLKKEGGASGLKPLKKAIEKLEKPSKFNLVKHLSKMTNVEKHKNSDYILTPIKEDTLRELIRENIFNVLTEKLCKKGQAYVRKRKAAGEKHGAYLMGRAVKVCKGQMQGENVDEVDMSINEVLSLEIDENITEAKYKGKTVQLNKPMRGDSKKFKVYVNSGKKNADGSIKVKKVNFGHGGTSAKRKTMRIRKSNPKRRKAFRARHRCDNPGPKTMARYWSCKKW